MKEALNLIKNSIWEAIEIIEFHIGSSHSDTCIEDSNTIESLNKAINKINEIENNSIKTDERIFKIVNANHEFTLANIAYTREFIDKGDRAVFYHLWNGKWARIAKKDIMQIKN